MDHEQVEFYSFKKLVVFGDECSGKTTLKNMLDDSNGSFQKEYIKSEKSILSNRISSQYLKDENKITLCFNLIEIRLEDKPLSAEILDTILYECQCAIFLFDTGSQSSLARIVNLLQAIKSNKKISSYDYMTFILLENKGDLVQSVSKEEIAQLIEKYEAKDKEKEMDLIHMRISLKDSVTSKDSFNQLMDLINTAMNNPKNRVSLNLVSISSKIVSTSNSIKIVLLGDSGVGKTAFINRHFKNEFCEAFLSTIGISEETEVVKVKGELYKLQIWDTAGQERFRCLPRKYYQNADGILLLFACDSKDSFNNVSKWMTDIETNTKDTLVYLLANKCDIEDKQVTRREGEEVAKNNKMEYYEISCKHNFNIDEVITKLVLSCFSKSNGGVDVFNLKEKAKGNRKGNEGGCCVKKK